MLCIDEKSQIQGLDRTAPMLPMQPGLPERRTHDYKRHGTTTLFAALEIATGKVTARTQPRHRHRAHPFVWTKTTDQILAKAKRPTTTHSGHLPLAPNRVPRGGGDP